MKTAGFRIRVEPDLRQAFVDACQANDQSAAQVLRSFMKRYIEDHSSSEGLQLLVAEEKAKYQTIKRKGRKREGKGQ